jgi:hypothetical protein
MGSLQDNIILEIPQLGKGNRMQCHRNSYFQEVAMKLSSAKRWRFICCAIALLAFACFTADYFIQISSGKPFEPTLWSRLFFIGMFPVFLAFFPWIATAVYNFHMAAPEPYRQAIKRGPTRKIAIEEYITK